MDTNAPSTTITSSTDDPTDTTPTFEFEAGRGGGDLRVPRRRRGVRAVLVAAHDRRARRGGPSIRGPRHRPGGQRGSDARRRGLRHRHRAARHVDHGRAGRDVERLDARVRLLLERVGVHVRVPPRRCGVGVCQSPNALGTVADGLHSFEVRAVDRFGNTDQSPAAHAFLVDTQGPAMAIDGGTVKVRKGVAKVDVTCPGAELSGPCTGELKLEDGREGQGRKGQAQGHARECGLLRARGGDRRRHYQALQVEPGAGRGPGQGPGDGDRRRGGRARQRAAGEGRADAEGRLGGWARGQAGTAPAANRCSFMRMRPPTSWTSSSR